MLGGVCRGEEEGNRRGNRGGEEIVRVRTPGAGCKLQLRDCEIVARSFDESLAFIGSTGWHVQLGRPGERILMSGSNKAGFSVATGHYF